MNHKHKIRQAVRLERPEWLRCWIQPVTVEAGKIRLTLHPYQGGEIPDGVVYEIADELAARQYLDNLFGLDQYERGKPRCIECCFEVEALIAPYSDGTWHAAKLRDGIRLNEAK